MEFLSILHDASSFPSLTLPKILHFIRVAEFLRPFIEAHELDIAHPPEALRLPALLMLSRLIQVDLETTKGCWKMFKNHIWASHTTVKSGVQLLEAQDVHLFNIHGLEFKTCMLHQRRYS